MAGGVLAGRLSIELVAEIARLQQDLDKAKKLVNSASNDIAKSARAANDSLAGMAGGIARTGNQSKLASHHMANLSFQIQDIIIGLQGGQKPMTVFLQQGSQIGQIMGQAGIGVGGLAKAMGAMVLNFAKAHPVMLAVAAAGGAVFANMKMLNSQWNAQHKGELDAYVASLGLKEKELRKLGPLTITLGDQMTGLWTVIKRGLELESVFSFLGDAAKKHFNIIVNAGKLAAAGLYAFFAAGIDNIAETWKRLPGILGDAAVSAANAAITAIEALINWQIAGINMLIGGINAVLGPFMDKAISPIGPVQLGRVKDEFAGAGKAAGEAFASNYKSRFDQAIAGMNAFGKAWEDATVQAAKDRYRAAAEEKGYLDPEKAKKSAKKAVDATQKELQRLIDWMERNQPQWFGDITKRTQSMLPDGDATLKAVLAEIKAKKDAADRLREAEEEWQRQDRQRALDTAYDIADIIGGGVGRAIGELANALDRAFPDFVAKIGQKIGLNSKLFGQLSAGAQIGGATDGIFDSIGIKSSKTGAQIGGMIGSFAGPLGAIAGSIVGGIVGGMVKSTPRASATVSIIAGEAMDSAIKGNKAGLKKIAGGLADSVISGLSGLADQLGAQLIGDASVSIGIRKKNYRVDPTGQGITKTSKGAIDFGDDQAAAVAYAIQIAIQQGVLGGLSESMKRLIMADGDLQTQIQKALSFKDVFDQLAQRDDPAKWAQDEVTRWHDAMAKIFAEAGATADELAELERLTGIKRADAAKEAADKIAQAAREALEEQNRLNSMRATILELEGKTLEALNLRREVELSTMSEAERALQQRIHALQDEAEAAAKAAAEAEKLAEQRRNESQIATSLINQLLELDGNVAALRARELAQLPEHLRYLQELIWARKDEAEAMERVKAIADERYGLETQWYQLIGDEATLRARALARLDESNRALQQQIYDEQDRQAAVKAAQDALKGEIDARNSQISAINSTISALSQASQRWSEMAAQIREFRAGLFAPANNGGLSYSQALTEFQNVSRMAALGNEASLQSFTGTAQSFLSAALNNATSLVDYQRAIGLVAGASDAAAKGADGMARATADQYAVLLAQRSELETLNEQTQLQLETLAQTADVQASDVVPALKDLVRAEKERADKAEATRAEEKAESIAIINLLAEQNAFLRRVIQDDRLNVFVDGGSSSVTVSNGESNPVRTLEVTP